MTGLINHIPKEALYNIFEYSGDNHASVCKKFKEITEKRGKEIGKYICKNQSPEDFVENLKFGWKDTTCIDMALDAKDEDNLPSNEAIAQLKKDLPFVQEIHFSVDNLRVANTAFICNTLTHFQNVKKLSVKKSKLIKSSDTEGHDNEKIVFSKIITLQELRHLQLRHFKKMYFTSMSEAHPFLTRLKKPDVGSELKDLSDIEVADQPHFKYAASYVATCNKVTSRCCCCLPQKCIGIITLTPLYISAIGYVAVKVSGIAVGVGAILGAPVYGYHRAYQFLLTAAGIGPVSAFYTVPAAVVTTVVTAPAIKRLLIGTYHAGTRCATTIKQAAAKVWNVASRLFCCSSRRHIAAA